MESPSSLLNTNSGKKTALKKLKFSVTFRETEITLLSYIFFKKVCLIFPEMELSSLSNKKLQERTFQT